MTQIKTIDQVECIPMNCWQVADELFGKDAVAKNHTLAKKAADQMRKAGWTFFHYDATNGSEVHNPPEEAQND